MCPHWIKRYDDLRRALDAKFNTSHCYVIRTLSILIVILLCCRQLNVIYSVQLQDS